MTEKMSLAPPHPARALACLRTRGALLVVRSATTQSPSAARPVHARLPALLRRDVKHRRHEVKEEGAKEGHEQYLFR